MGKKNSKLKQEEVETLKNKTYCKFYFISFFLYMIFKNCIFGKM